MNPTIFFKRERVIRIVLLLLFTIFFPNFAHAECVRSLEHTLAELERTLPTRTVTVTNVSELVNAVKQANNTGGNATILLEDGTYSLSNMLHITADNVAFRSASGNRDAVILKGKGMQGSVPHVFLVSASYFTAADLTLGWVANHGIQIQGEEDADAPLIHNVYFVDTGEQMLKVSKNATTVSSDDGLVEWSVFEYSAGVGPQYYIGGIDAHKAKRWIIRDNVFRHIRSPESGLAEHAIHFWSGAADTVVENNIIVDCDRGIGFGLGTSSHSGGVIRNNMVYTTRDIGIGLENSSQTNVYNNTVYTANYFNSIEYRFANTYGGEIANNLTNKTIASRDHGTAELSNNLTTAQQGWFVNPSNADLHLISALPAVVDQGKSLADVATDIDCEARPQGTAYDIGADEFLSAPPVRYTLTVALAGTGTGSVNSKPEGISCGTQCSAAFQANTIVILTAAADSDSEFESWTGACTGDSDECAITMNAAKNVTATFTQRPVLHSLIVNTTGDGDGSVTSEPTGIDCGSQCQADYEEGTSVLLTAAAETGSVFDGWTGACTGDSDECIVLMNETQNVTATFRIAITTSSYFGFNDFGGTWHDAGQTSADHLVWAAAAANILEWSGWNTPIYETAQEIYNNFDTNWTDAPGLMEYGWDWWLNGYEPTPIESQSQVNGSTGNYWSQYNFFNYFYEDWADFSEGQWSNGSHLLQTIDSYLHSGYGVTLAAYGNDAIHALTVWGYEYDNQGNYLGLWLTDSQDALNDMFLVALEPGNNNLWYLDPENQYGYQNWFIGGIQALDRRPELEPIPEPGTLLLLGIGLAVLALKRRNSGK